MLKKLTNNKKGFTLVEVLIAVAILGIIVGPLLASLFSNNRVLSQARKETEATYVAKKIMEETMADYYYDRSTAIVESENYIAMLQDLLSNNSSGLESFKDSVFYSGESSKFADKFSYKISIVPSGKDGEGVPANYLHLYIDKNTFNGEVCYMVLPNGEMSTPVMLRTGGYNVFNVNDESGMCTVEYNNTETITGQSFGGALNTSKRDFRALCYSSNDSLSYNLQFKTETGFSGNVFLTNYTSSALANKVSVKPVDSGDLELTNNKEEFCVSSREAWSEALYEITVDVFEGSKLLSSVSSVIEVRIFN